MKIAINIDYGGAALSDEALERLEELGSTIDYSEWRGAWRNDDKSRTDPILIQVLEELGEERSAQQDPHRRKPNIIRVVDVPDGVKWTIHDYDGRESVHEIHRVWRGNREDPKD